MQFRNKREHHHNLVRRVWLLPMTHRGRIIRKMLANHYLHFFVSKSDKSETLIIPFADVADAWKFIDKNQSVLDGFESDFYLMYNLIRLIDVIVGNEPDMDFHIRLYDQFIQPIGNVQLYLVLWQFCTLDGVAKLNQNICHRKVTAVSPFCDELWAFVTKCDTCVTPYVTLQDTAVTLLWQMLRPTWTTIQSV